jgi:N-acetylglutamate synthase-like GNAT family acetyltransferase
MMPVGARKHASASARIAVPKSLPMHLRAKVRELVAVKSTNPGKGEADALLANICTEANATGTTLMLMVDSGDKERLANWYQRHGFRPIQTAPLLMARFAA